jgi:hypothetical protein
VRKMTPEQRLKECVNLSELQVEFRRIQKRLLKTVLPRTRK